MFHAPAPPCKLGLGFCPAQQAGFKTVRALRYIKPMPGGSAAALVEASDGCTYVVKTQRADLAPGLLANEFIGTRLAALLGLPVAPMAAVEIRLPFLRANYRAMCAGCQDFRWFVPGLAFGSLAPCEPARCWASGAEALRAVNVGAFAGMLLFDIWTANADTRQVVLLRRAGQSYACMIDQGHCFSAGRWHEVADAPVMPLFRCPKIYRGITGWASFEPYLSSIEALSSSAVMDAVRFLPSEWLTGGPSALESLAAALTRRGARVRDVVTQVLVRRADLFPQWFGSPLADLVRLPPRAAPAGAASLVAWEAV